MKTLSKAFISFCVLAGAVSAAKADDSVSLLIRGRIDQTASLCLGQAFRQQTRMSLGEVRNIRVSLMARNIYEMRPSDLVLKDIYGRQLMTRGNTMIDGRMSSVRLDVFSPYKKFASELQQKQRLTMLLLLLI